MMPNIPAHQLRCDDLGRMTPAQLEQFHKEVGVIARRLLDGVRKEVSSYGPWVHARFWSLASALPMIKNRLDWRDDTIRGYQEVAKGQAQALISRRNPERHKDRNNEITRLYGLGLTPGRIHIKIRKRWPTMENGKALTVNAIKSVIRNRTKGLRRGNSTV
jgi:hypothetical protein